MVKIRSAPQYLFCDRVWFFRHSNEYALALAGREPTDHETPSLTHLTMTLGQEMSHIGRRALKLSELRLGSLVVAKRSNGTFTAVRVSLPSESTPPGFLRIILSHDGAWKDEHPSNLFSIDQDYHPNYGSDVHAYVYAKVTLCNKWLLVEDTGSVLQ